MDCPTELRKCLAVIRTPVITYFEEIIVSVVKYYCQKLYLSLNENSWKKIVRNNSIARKENAFQLCRLHRKPLKNNTNKRGLILENNRVIRTTTMSI